MATIGRHELENSDIIVSIGWPKFRRCSGNFHPYAPSFSHWMFKGGLSRERLTPAALWASVAMSKNQDRADLARDLVALAITGISQF
jgi:hypothetical protein